MVDGIGLFREHFRGMEDAYVVIGGVACDEWFAEQGLRFRTTKDVDVVLLLEATDAQFVRRLWGFVEAGRYESRQRSTGKRCYYRFYHPAMRDFPAMIELFSRQPSHIDIGAGQTVVPIPAAEDLSSLSAILMDDEYYDLVCACREVHDGLPLLRPEALIALKAAAWLDLERRKRLGERIDARDVKKHRNDLFRLAHILPAGRHLELPLPVGLDLSGFLRAHPVESDQWDGIVAAVRTSIPAPMAPGELLAFLAEYFRIPLSESGDE